MPDDRSIVDKIRDGLRKERGRTPPPQTQVQRDNIARINQQIKETGIDTRPHVSPNTRKFASSSQVVQQFLESRKRGDLDARGYTRLQRIMENMFYIATSKSPRNVDAAKFIIERGYGRAKPSDEAIDAIQRGGIQLVYVAPPDVLAGEDRKALPPKPDFIDAQFEENEDD